MAFEDLFGGTAENMVGVPNVEDAGFDFAGLFKDPNFVRGLGETGSQISSGESIGKSVGDFASNLTRRRAVQKGARDSRTNQGSFQEKILALLKDGSLLSGKDQNDAFDTLNIDGDGNVNLGMKNTPQKPGFGKNQPLESIRRPAAGGDDLPDFSNQPGGGELDFAGLDAEDIGMLLQAEQQFGEFDQRQMKMILDEKNKRQAAITASRQRSEDLAQLATDRTATIEAKRLEVEEKKNIANTLAESKTALEQLKIDAGNAKTPEEKKTMALELRKLTKEVENLESGTGTTAIEEANIARINADIANKETELGIKLDTLEKDELLSVAPSFVDDKGVEVKIPFEEREANANQANNRPNGKVFYSVSQPVEDAPGVYNWGTDMPGEVTPVFLPKHPTTGKQITNQDVLDTAAANKISPEEVLKQWGLVK